MITKNCNEQKLKQKIKEQEQVIEMLSNQKVVKGLISALKDFEEGRYTILTN